MNIHSKPQYLQTNMNMTVFNHKHFKHTHTVNTQNNYQHNTCLVKSDQVGILLSHTRTQFNQVIFNYANYTSEYLKEAETVMNIFQLLN